MENFPAPKQAKYFSQQIGSGQVFGKGTASALPLKPRKGCGLYRLRKKLDVALDFGWAQRFSAAVTALF
jgi:hypothetical protein